MNFTTQNTNNDKRRQLHKNKMKVARKSQKKHEATRRPTSFEPNHTLMREKKGFFSFAFDSAHLKYGV